jgi:hypothetical protein
MHTQRVKGIVMAKLEATAWYDVVVEAITDMRRNLHIECAEAESLVESLGPKESYHKVLAKT